MAISRFNAFSRMARELEEARSELENRKLIDRAKGILMKSRGLSEEEAYALLRKTAMNQNRKIAEIAQSLVTAAGLLGPEETMTMSPEHQITAGFMPLLRQRRAGRGAGDGFCRSARASTSRCVRETSWANIRDRIAVGHFDVAHMLAPMPIACNLGLTPLAVRHDRADGARARRQLRHRLATRSGRAWRRMAQRRSRPGTAGAALARARRERAQRGKRTAALRASCIRIPGTITSCATGSRPAASIPTATSRSSSCRRPSWPMRSAPAASTAIASASRGTAPRSTRGIGHIATVKAAIWRTSPEKVLGVRKAWAESESGSAGGAAARAPSRRRAGARIRQTTTNWPR